MNKNSWIKLGLAALLPALALGCESWGPHGLRAHRANSLYNYLYADQSEHTDAATIPVLSLPLRVGVAFVPGGAKDGHDSYTALDNVAFSENEKMSLLRQISEQFKSRPFVKSIELIPSPYLTPKGGFPNLDQIRQIYGVDVMVLLSYDQAQFTDEGVFSFAYWTIVGLYVVPAEKNSTQTLLDAAVYDIASRKLLFRAPGLSQEKQLATPVNLTEALRRDSAKGFQDAATNLVAALNVQLDALRERVKNAPSEYKIVTKPGYNGAAALGGIETLLLCALGLGSLWTRRAARP